MKGFNKLLVGVAFCGGLASQAFAATTDGTLGATSTGTADIAVTIPNMAKITGVETVTVAYPATGGNVDTFKDVCVYSNFATANRYSVKVNGGSNPKVTSPTAGFYIGRAATDQEIAYTIEWNDAAGTTGAVGVTHNTPLTTQSGSNSPDCGSADNASYRVQIAEAGLLAVKAGAYTGTITILITPE